MSRSRFILWGVVLAASVFSCAVEPDPTPNPFGSGPNEGEVPDTVDPTTIQGLHRNIFAVRCANPTCHDGSFEPDFRTVESTYQTLVYHPVTKNTADEAFEFRVKPGSHAESWLYERLITTDDVIGRMPLYAEPLSSQELGWVRDWINAGAPDSDGNPAVYPNQLPSVETFAIFNATGQRIDTLRSNGQLSPLILPDSTNVILYTLVEDDSTALANLQVNQLKLANDEYDFSNAVTKQATLFNNFVFATSFNTAEFSGTDTTWFRYYVRDTDNPQTVEFPSGDSPFYFRIIASFVVQ